MYTNLIKMHVYLYMYYVYIHVKYVDMHRSLWFPTSCSNFLIFSVMIPTSRQHRMHGTELESVGSTLSLSLHIYICIPLYIYM